MKCPRCDGTGELHGDEALFVSIGMKIANFRTTQGLTQHELAVKLEVGRTQLANIEQGRGVGSLPTVYKIAAALGIEAKELLP